MTQPTVLTSPDQITTSWLEAVLKQSGALTRGTVAAFEVIKGSGNWSANARLRVRYTGDAQGHKPEQLFLKCVKTDLGDESFGPSEVTYYTRDYAGAKNAPLIRCYDARITADHHHYHLLLDDVSPTHTEALSKTPVLEYGLALAEGMAALHAHWWGQQRLAVAHAPIHDARHIRRFIDIAEPGAGHIIDELAGELKSHWPETLHNLFDRLPAALIARTQDGSGFTLIHGDPGANNILVPRDGHRPLYIIDRQPFNWSLTTWLGVYDLAYAMVLDWDIEKRRVLEIPVLKHYHRHLLQNGVEEYPWQQLFDDYRLSAGTVVCVAVEYCRGGINHRWKDVWLSFLKRSLTTCDDLNCAELWN